MMKYPTPSQFRPVATSPRPPRPPKPPRDPAKFSVTRTITLLVFVVLAPLLLLITCLGAIQFLSTQ